MNIARGYAFSLKDMFKNFRHKKLKITCQECLKLFKTSHKDEVGMRVMLASMELIMNDILENGVIFKIPGCKAEIKMRRICDDDFKIARSRGAFPNIDFLKTQFTAYRPALYMYNSNKTRIKPIYMNKEYTKKLDEYVNSGKKY